MAVAVEPGFGLDGLDQPSTQKKDEISVKRDGSTGTGQWHNVAVYAGLS